jgi:hypothetical protein
MTLREGRKNRRKEKRHRGRWLMREKGQRRRHMRKKRKEQEMLRKGRREEEVIRVHHNSQRRRYSCKWLQRLD